MTFLLESVAGVESARTSYPRQQAVIRARGDLCTSYDKRKALEYILSQNQYEGKVLEVRSHSFSNP